MMGMRAKKICIAMLLIVGGIIVVSQNICQ